MRASKRHVALARFRMQPGRKSLRARTTTAAEMTKESEGVEASTGIEPVYTDLQSAASPLRQLADLVVERGLHQAGGGCKRAIGCD